MKLSDWLEQYIYGVPGETLFHKPFPHKVTEFDDAATLLKRMIDSGDQRAHAIVAALISETYVDRLLCLLLPSYPLEGEQATRKIKLLTAFEIIPKHLTEAADLLQRVRNKFAHHLEIASFDEFKDRFPKDVERLQSFAGRRGLRSRGLNDVSLLFEDVTTVAIAGLKQYIENVRYYTSLIRSKEFIETLSDQHAVEHQNHLKIVLEALKAYQSAPRRT